MQASWKRPWKGPFPELGRELQLPTPSTSVSERSIASKGAKYSHCRAWTHMGTGGHYKTFQLWGNQECISCTIQTCIRRSPEAGTTSSPKVLSYWAATGQLQGPQPLLGCRLKNCYMFAPHSLWVWKEEKRSPSLNENKLCEELLCCFQYTLLTCLSCC